MEPIACARRDPESKGVVEAKVRDVKHNALAGRADELTSWEDYGRLAVRWRDEVANVRLHQATKQRPVDRFEQERERLRPLPALPFDTDEILSVIVTSHARVHFDGNRYSVPPEIVGKTALLRADGQRVRVLYQGQEVAAHPRCYDRGQVLCQTEHHLAALKLRSRVRARELEDTFDALGPEARQFHLELRRRPLKTAVHLRRVLHLVQLYGRDDVRAALVLACQYGTYDAAYVETLVLQERRRRELPSPTPLRPQRQELIDDIQLDEPDPAAYDRLCEEPPAPPQAADQEERFSPRDLPSDSTDQESAP